MCVVSVFRVCNSLYFQHMYTSFFTRNFTEVRSSLVLTALHPYTYRKRHIRQTMFIFGVTSLYVFMFYPLIILFIKHWGTVVTHGINSNYQGNQFSMYIFFNYSLGLYDILNSGGVLLPCALTAIARVTSVCIYILTM